jgi:siroheme synthase
MSASTMRGKIYLMGAGTGDPHLLTAEAVRLLREAEVVLHDETVPPEILDLVPASAQVRNVDKLCELAGFSQDKTNALLIDSAREGRLVVRLKSGDQPLPERVAEEMVALAQAGVDFELISGAGTAMAAAAGQNSTA